MAESAPAKWRENNLNEFSCADKHSSTDIRTGRYDLFLIRTPGNRRYLSWMSQARCNQPKIRCDWIQEKKNTMIFTSKSAVVFKSSITYDKVWLGGHHIQSPDICLSTIYILCCPHEASRNVVSPKRITMLYRRERAPRHWSDSGRGHPLPGPVYPHRSPTSIVEAQEKHMGYMMVRDTRSGKICWERKLSGEYWRCTRDRCGHVIMSNECTDGNIHADGCERVLYQ